MIGKKLDKSIVITGASATGKTTLCRRLLVHFGLQPLPSPARQRFKIVNPERA